MHIKYIRNYRLQLDILAVHPAKGPRIPSRLQHEKFRVQGLASVFKALNPKPLHKVRRPKRILIIRHPQEHNLDNNHPNPKAHNPVYLPHLKLHPTSA